MSSNPTATETCAVFCDTQPHCKQDLNSVLSAASHVLDILTACGSRFKQAPSNMQSACSNINQLQALMAAAASGCSTEPDMLEQQSQARQYLKTPTKRDIAKPCQKYRAGQAVQVATTA
jgi:hypothetical protein